MIVLAVVWVLASGQIRAEPWVSFGTMDECHHFRDALRTPIRDKFMLFSGCLDTSAASTYEAFEFDLYNNLK